MELIFKELNRFFSERIAVLDMRTERWVLKPKSDNIPFGWKRLYNDPGTDPNERLDGCPKLGNRKDKYQYSLSRLIWIDWKEQWSRLSMRRHNSNAFSPSTPEGRSVVVMVFPVRSMRVAMNPQQTFHMPLPCSAEDTLIMTFDSVFSDNQPTGKTIWENAECRITWIEQSNRQRW